MSTSILLRAPLLTQSGYAIHSRQIAKWLFEDAQHKFDLDITTELLNWGSTHWIVDSEACDGLIGEMAQATNNVKKDGYDITIQLQLPDEWNPTLGKFNIGITALVETDVCNPSWVEACNRMSLVIVPCKQNKKTLEMSGKLTTPVLVVPEAFPDAILNYDNVSGKLDLNLETKFNFLLIGTFTGNSPDTDRKNIPYTIKWFMETFRGNKDVGLIVKTTMTGAGTHLDKTITRNIMKQLLAEIGDHPDNPKVYFLHGHMSDEEMAGLYKHQSVKALLSLTHGESWNLPAIEAAASGLPVIASDWSAHKDFLDHGKWIKVPGGLDMVHPSKADGRIFLPGMKWFYPSEKHAKDAMKKFFSSPELPMKWAKELSTTIKEKYSQSSISGYYTALFEDMRNQKVF